MEKLIKIADIMACSRYSADEISKILEDAGLVTAIEEDGENYVVVMKKMNVSQPFKQEGINDKEF